MWYLFSNNTSLADESIRKCAFTVIDVSNHRHVSDVILIIHDLSDLLNGEVNHFPFSTTI